jgi:hypothetical protein
MFEDNRLQIATQLLVAMINKADFSEDINSLEQRQLEVNLAFSSVRMADMLLKANEGKKVEEILRDYKSAEEIAKEH